jgi:hypothetical protein
LVAFSESYETLKSCVAFRPLSALRILDSCTPFFGFSTSTFKPHLSLLYESSIRHGTFNA